MLEFLPRFFFTSDQFIPHGHCYLWKPGVLWLHIASDSLIALSYYSVVLALVYFVFHRPDLPYYWLFLAFSAFTFLCGTTHIMEVSTIWHPTYWLSGFIKALTAFISVYTACLLIPIVPLALTLPNPKLEEANRQLQKAKEELEKNYGLLHAVIEGTPDPIFVKDLQGCYVMINSATARVFGRSVEESIGKDDTELFSPEIGHQLRETDRRIMTTDTPQILEEVVIGSDNIPRTYLSMKSVYHDPHGNVIGLIGIVRDISERKMAEEALKKANEQLEIRVEKRTAALQLACEQLQNEIAERKQIELALRESEERLRFTLNAAQMGVWDWEIAINKVTWSEGVETLFGIPRGSFGGTYEAFLSYVHPEDKDKVIQAVTRTLETGSNYEIENRIIQPDGTIRWLGSKGALLRDETGNIVRMAGTVQDITDRTIAEEALRESEAGYRRLIETATEGIWILDAEGKTTFANAKMAEMLGYTVEEMIGMTLFAFMDAEEQAIATKNLERRSQGISEQHDFKFCCKDGSELWTVISANPILDTAGQYVGALGMITDITKRKAAEEALRQSEAKFRELAQREALLNQLASQIRRSLDLNTILETAVYEIRKLLQIDRCLFIWYRPEAEEPVWEVVQEARTCALPSLIGYRVSVTALGPLAPRIFNKEITRVDDARTLSDPVEQQYFSSVGYTALLALPIHTTAGEIGVVSCGHSSGDRPWRDSEVELLQGVAHQIAIAIDQAQLLEQSRTATATATEQATKLEQTLHELQQAQAQLVQSEKMSSLGQMVAGVAHEINNPINFIYGNLTHINQYGEDLLNLIQLYQESYPYPLPEIQARGAEIEIEFIKEDLPKILSSMKMGAQRIRNIVLSLRNFSRLDEAEMKRVDIHEGIDNTLLILEHRLRGKQSNVPEIQVIKDYGNLPKVKCCAGQLNQVFMNILTNAIDAIEEYNKSRSLEDIKNNPSTIRICTEVNETNQVMIRFIDNGLGMTEEVQRRVFDPFFTTKPVGSGTGLGLSISYQVIEKHGGQLKCISAPGQGTEFSISLPIEQKNLIPSRCRNTIKEPLQYREALQEEIGNFQAGTE